MKQDLAQIEQFLDALWLERNLAENTLSAYRRDLTMLVEWLHHRGLSLASVGSDDESVVVDLVDVRPLGHRAHCAEPARPSRARALIASMTAVFASA